LVQELLRIVRWVDVIDILLVTFIVYRLLILIKGTRAAQVILGFVVLFGIYWIAGRLEIRTLRAVLAALFDNLFIILVLVFQQEIRRALSRVGQTPLFATGGGMKEGQVVEEIVKS